MTKVRVLPKQCLFRAKIHQSPKSFTPIELVKILMSVIELDVAGDFIKFDDP